LLALLLALPVMIACPKPPPADQAAPPAAPSGETAKPPAPAPVEEVQEPAWREPEEPAPDRLSSREAQAEQFTREGVLQTVYFATDKSDLTPEARAILARNAAWLRAHAEFGAVAQGYCDERNTEEYNLALGERRAEAVRAYLASLGVADARMETISYGEERPADPGHTEAAWAKNRRVEFVVKAM
jgi:peptidoglycan-associated lipoprotein